MELDVCAPRCLCMQMRRIWIAFSPIGFDRSLRFSVRLLLMVVGLRLVLSSGLEGRRPFWTVPQV